MLHTVAVALAVPLLLLGHHVLEGLPLRGRVAWRALAVALVVGSATPIVRHVAGHFDAPPEWDFLAFWTSARVAALGLDFYDPAQLAAVARPLGPSAVFHREILDVGFWYPPLTMLWLLPLGWLEPVPALGAWYALHGLALGVATWALAAVFLGRGRGRGDALLLTAALVALAHGTRATFGFAQTNFLLLAALALAWRAGGGLRSGSLVTAAALVKPWVALLLVPLAAAGAWRLVAGALVSGGGALVAGLAVFGTGPFRSYLTDPPSARLPDTVLVEWVNQSILAVLSRAAARAEGPSEAWPYFVWGGAVLVLTVVTVLAARTFGRRDRDLALAVALPFALLVYPATLMHYSTMMLVPTLVLWARRGALPGAPWTAILVVTTGYVFADLADGAHTILAHLLWWLTAVALAALLGASDDRPAPAA